MVAANKTKKWNQKPDDTIVDRVFFLGNVARRFCRACITIVLLQFEYTISIGVSHGYFNVSIKIKMAREMWRTPRTRFHREKSFSWGNSMASLQTARIFLINIGP